MGTLSHYINSHWLKGSDFRTRHLQIFLPSFSLVSNFHFSNVHCVAFLVLVLRSGASIFFQIYIMSSHLERFELQYFIANNAKAGNILKCHEYLLFFFYSFFYYVTNHVLITWSISPRHPFTFWHSTLSMLITFRSYLAIISDHFPYCPMLLSFDLSTQLLIYLIIFVPLKFRLIVLRSAFFLLDVLLHLSLGIVPHCHSY